MDKKVIIGIIIVVIVIIAAALVLPGMLNDGSNIKLIKEETGGEAFMSSSSGKPVYDYYIRGVLQNLPSDDSYEVKIVAYDQSGGEIKGVNYFPCSIESLRDAASDSEVSGIGTIESSTPLNISKIDVIVLNPDGEEVFKQTVDFDMNNFDISGLMSDNSTSTSTDSSGNSVSYSDENGSYTATEENGVYHYKGTYNGMSYDYKLDENGNFV